MTALPRRETISIADYLAGELVSPVKHEYLGGQVYAMAGAKVAHNRIAGNIFGQLYLRLRQQPCQPFNSDMKIRVEMPTHERFYYPDISVVCESNAPEEMFQSRPRMIWEVISEATRRIDEGEKKDAYLSIPSLHVYAICECESPSVTIFRRTEQGFVREIYDGLNAVIPLPEIATLLPLAEIYENVAFVPESADDPQTP